MEKISIDKLNTALKDNILERSYELHRVNDIFKKYKGLKLGISADWGTGKTYLSQFLYHISKHDLDPSIVEKYGDLEYIKSSKVIYFDAAQEDIFDNPLLSIARTIAFELEKEGAFKKSNFLKGMYEVVSNIEGIGFLFKMMRGIKIAGSEENLFDEFKNTNNILELIQKELSKEDNFILIIDELDRCDPEYILKIFKVIKYFYSLENLQVIFVYSYKELWNLIRTKYGYENEQYLQKFIDYEITLHGSSDNDYAKNCNGLRYGGDYLTMCQAMYDLNPREINNLKFICEEDTLTSPLYACLVCHCKIKHYPLDKFTKEELLKRLEKYEVYDYARGFLESFKKSLEVSFEKDNLDFESVLKRY